MKRRLIFSSALRSRIVACTATLSILAVTGCHGRTRPVEVTQSPADAGALDWARPAPDSSRKDLVSLDAALDNACNSAWGREVRRFGRAAKCLTTTGRWFDQCEAELLCNREQGWRLCPASVYARELASSGLAPEALHGYFGWLGSCIRERGQLISPSEQRCTSCSAAPAPSRTVWWKCGSGVPIINIDRHANVGLQSFDVCRRGGTNRRSSEGFWEPRDASSKLPAALCCKLGEGPNR